MTGFICKVWETVYRANIEYIPLAQLVVVENCFKMF